MRRLIERLGFTPLKAVYSHYPSDANRPFKAFKCKVSGRQTPQDLEAEFVCRLGVDGTVEDSFYSSIAFPLLDTKDMPDTRFDDVEGRGYVGQFPDTPLTSVNAAWLYPDEQTLGMSLRITGPSAATAQGVYNQAHTDVMRDLLHVLIRDVVTAAAGPAVERTTLGG